MKVAELEPHKQRRDPEHQNKKLHVPSSTLNEEDGINQSKIK